MTKTNKNVKQKEIAILGSTGSIGTQTLDIIAEYPYRFRVSLLTARSRWELLAEQARRFNPRRVVIADERFLEPLRRALADLPVEVFGGEKAIEEAAAMPESDMVVTAMVGYSGLLPTVAAIKAGKTIALANKETLVVAGSLITRLAREHGVSIVPVDSEHSAIFQCLEGEGIAHARKIILTASGGPFRTVPAAELPEKRAADALRHPNWDMGAKVTIDSATMMNKGFEMIEAHWLFNCPPDRIEIVVHPQSIVHSMVEFEDGSIKAQLGVPDMHLPIRYALGYPERLHTKQPPLNLSQYSRLTFEAPDLVKFPLLGYAFEAIERGGTLPCILNAANEVAVAAFLKDEIRFTQIAEIVRKTMDSVPVREVSGLDVLVETNEQARLRAREILAEIISPGVNP